MEVALALFYEKGIYWTKIEDITERADVEYVRILHLAAVSGESAVRETLDGLLTDARPFDYALVQALVTPPTPTIPTVRLPTPDLTVYDALLCGGGR